MKFTFPILTLCIGGAQRMLAELANGLTARGHDVTILMPSQGAINYELSAKLVRTAHDYQIIETDYPYSDVIVSNYYTTVPSANEASRNGKGLHIRMSLCYEPLFLPENHLSFPTYHTTQNIIVLSKWQQQLIFLLHGISGHIVPVGISKSFQNLHFRGSQSKLQVSAIVRRPEGGFSWHREQDYMIAHLQSLIDRYPDVEFNLFCPPDELATSPILQQLKTSARFRFYTPGDDREMCYHYNQTDIFVSSSTYDSASLPGLEAMKCGAALVTTYSGGNQDYCLHEENCLLSYRYENRLGYDVERLLNDSSLLRRLASKGEKQVQKWTWERSLSAFEEALSAIMQKR